jgi:uroporphyrinogen decarboxylase
MNARERLLETFSFSGCATPPRYESAFSDEVLQAWRSEGALDERSPEVFFGLDRSESLPVEFSPPSEARFVVQSETDLGTFRHAYDASRTDVFPADWTARLEAWRGRAHPLAIEPWNQGFFQVIGIKNGATLNVALALLCEQPALAEAQMEHYAVYLETLIDRALTDVDVDYALLYEPIASKHSIVISPQMYRQFVWRPLRRIADCLERHRVLYRFMWTSGRVVPLVPLWIDAGINGLVINRGAECGVTYARLRAEFGRALRFFGGVDGRTVARGPEAIDEVLECDVRPLLEQGGYIPHLDETVRTYIPFDHFRYYRERLNDLLEHF